LDEQARAAGRALLADYATEQGNPGMPADARTLISVGAVNGAGRPEAYRSLGPAFDQALRPRPDSFSFDELSVGVDTASAAAGTGLAAAFAGGTAASALSAGMPAESFLFAIHRQPGGLLRIRPAAQPTRRN
jgi:hypothetical protein